MQNIILSITKFLSPPYCIGCEKLLADYTILCDACQQALPKVFSREIAITASRSIVLHALTAYQKPIDNLIQAKLNAQRIPIYQLSFLLSEYVKQKSIECDFIVPIPLHWQRKMWRGFNQAEILAQRVGQEIKKPVIDGLIRNKHTSFQSTLSAQERQVNVADVFNLNKQLAPDFLKNKRILLIDDLYTTGATATAAARELYRAGAQSVELLVAGKVID